MLEAVYVSSLICTLLLIAVFNSVADINRSAKRSMVLLMTSGFFWGLFRYLAGIASNESAKLLFEISLVAATFAPIFLLHFVGNFPLKEKVLFGAGRAVVYIIGASITLSLISGSSINEIEKESFSIYVTNYGLGYIAFFAYQVIFFSLGFVFLYRKYQATKNKYIRKIIRDLFVAIGSIFITSVLVGVTLDLILTETNQYMSLIEFPVTIVATAFFVLSAITNLKNINQDLNSKLDMNMEVINLLSHQLRTPLTTISNYSTILMHGGLGTISNSQMKAIEQIDYSSLRMAKIIKEFLSASQLEATNLNLKFNTVELENILRNIVQHYTAKTVEHRGKIRLESTTVYVSIDETKISEAISNIIDNALAYSGIEKGIKIFLSKDHAHCKFTVIDEGIGVPKGSQSQIFDKFNRASNAIKARPDGTGLGLPFVKKIVEAHGGEIIFKSKEGAGSTFGFTLPLAEPPR